MPHILYDNIIYSLQRSGGISSMWAMLESAMLDDKDFVCSYLEHRNAGKNLLRQILELPPEHIYASRQILPLSVARFCRADVPQSLAPQLFHSSYYRLPSDENIKTVVTVHDFTYEQYMSRWRRYAHCRQKYRAISTADSIVCVSQNTLADLLRFMPDIEHDKTEVIYNGVSPDFHPIEGIGCSGRLLYVGSRAAYKNFDLLVETLSSTTHALDICGAPLTAREVKLLDTMIGKSRYRMFSGIDNEALNELYNKALCLVYPSEYEGFGLPVIEAQSAGCPVIALNASSIPEIIGETPLLMPRADSKSLLAALNRLDNASTRSEAIEAGRCNALRFQAKAMADSYKSLYRQMVEK